MLCENCRKREANVKYSENINGVKKEMHLCEECSRELGITDKMDFRMPSLDISNFFGSFLEDFSTPDFMPLLNEVKQTKCDSCGSSFDDIINTGRYGCANCYDVFEDRMDPILKKLQGANRHNGRLGKISDNNVKFDKKEDKKEDKKSENKANNKLEKLQEELKQAIKEERYEEAAKIRDEIKGI
jgi:protein arginine kinase activator